MSTPLVISFETAADPKLLALAQQKAQSEGRELKIETDASGLVWLTPSEAANTKVYNDALQSVNGDWRRIHIKPL
jgi:hypothetical protein